MQWCLALSLALVLSCGGGTAAIDASIADDDGALASDAGNADAGPAVTRLMYLSTGSGNALKVLQLEPDGSMNALPAQTVDLGTRTGAMAYARSTRRLFLGTGQDIATFSLDSEGAPSLVGRTLDTGNPVYLEVAKNESLLVSAYFGLDRLKTHGISAGPPPPHTERHSLPSAEEPHLAIEGPEGLIYVPHRSGNTTQWYSLSSQGIFTIEGELAAETGAGPRHMIFSANDDFAYVVNEFDDSVSTHTVASDGSLTRVETLSTIPTAFDGNNNTCADVHLSPDGRFLYASNRGHDSIASFSVAGNGLLTFLGTTPTETTPREFDISPDGRFLVVAGQGNGFLQSFRIGSDGGLTSIDRIDVGDDPRWVIID
jgi:6-phosphogluconolactonase